MFYTLRTIPIDVRLVAATNRNLTQMMGEKLFRSDLYYRLKVFPITTPVARPPRGHTCARRILHPEVRQGNEQAS
jgi:transcriptional regulator with GAF, ATPase, and Fis domain